jgi:hypothetical protein
MPLIVAIGPLICALTLTTLAFFMFQAQTSRGAQAPSGLEPLEYTVILALSGALIALLMGALGLNLHNRARKAQEMRDEALAEGLARVERIESLVKRVSQRGEWREAAATAWIRREQRSLETIKAMAEPREALQRAAGDIWAGMSQPGMPLDMRTALGLTRQSAIAGAALGAALDELQAQLIALPADLDEMRAAGDTFYQELNALEEATRHLRLMLAVAAGGESDALTSHTKAVRPPAHAESPYETKVLGVVSPSERGGMGPDGIGGAMGGPRISPPGGIQPGKSMGQTGMRPAIRDPREAQQGPYTPRQGWPNSPSTPPRGPNPGGQSGQGPRQPGMAGPSGPIGPQPGQPGESGPRWRDPRGRDDNNSRWLND